MIDACPTPALVFDLARIEANLRAITAAARAHGIVPLFAAKSFPHPDVWALAAAIADGFDVASVGEARAVPAAKIVSIADPTGIASEARCERLIVSCETAEQAARAPAHAHVAIRLSASGRDPAIGAIRDGTGHRRSRFGLDVDRERRREHVRAIAAAAGTRPLGLHVHHGSLVATSPQRFADTAREALRSEERRVGKECRSRWSPYH